MTRLAMVACVLFFLASACAEMESLDVDTTVTTASGNSGTGTGEDTGTGSGQDTGTGASTGDEQDTGTGASTGDEQDTGTGAGTGSGQDTDTGTGSGQDTDTGTGSGQDTDTGTDDDTSSDVPFEETSIFYDSFEDPDVTGTTVTDPIGWVTIGHPSYIGLNDEDSGLFTTPYGNQALKIYGDATATTTPSILSSAFEKNTTYTVRFNVAKRNDQAATGYLVELLAIDDINTVETVLGIATGSSVDTEDMSQCDSIIFTPSADHENLGQRIAIRLKKRADTAWQTNPQYDNVELTSKVP